MPITALSYAPAVRRRTSWPALDYELFEAAVALADEGRPLDALTKTLEHLFPGRPVVDLTKEPFVFTQGSSRVTLRLDGDDVVASVPLVRIPGGGSAIAALRHVLTAIAGTGQLYQPRLRGDDLYLEFRDPLSHVHPAKLSEVLRRMPREADDRDDWLIGQFGAQPLDRADIAALSADELARATALWRTHWSEVEELVKECQRKRSMFFLNELTAFAIHRPFATLPLHGFLAARFREAASTFNDTNEDPMKRESVLAKAAKDMLAVSDDELAKSLGFADYALAPVAPGKPSVLSDHVGEGNYMETVEKLLAQGQSMDAALALVGTYYFLLSRFSWPEPVEAELVGALASVGGKPWRETASTLLAHAEAISDKYGSDESDEDDDDDDEDDDGDDEDGEES